MPFIDRADAGRRLAALLDHLRGSDVVVVGLPRGGVPVAFEVARALGAPLDVIAVRKVGVPFQPELAMGAIGEAGARVVDERVVAAAGISSEEFAAVEARERVELERRVRRFRGERPPVSLAGRTVVVVDDGIATGSTARAACQVARARGAARVVLAIPVAPPESVATLSRDADEVVCVETPVRFFAIGEFYEDFTQTSDAEVIALLERAVPLAAVTAHPTAIGGRGPSATPDPPLRDEDVEVRAGTLRLSGHLTVPEGVTGIVVFAHGSGSSRHSPRNRFVASVLNRDGLGTLLFDLLTPEEEVDRANVFDISLLGHRLVEVTRWLRADPTAATLRVGYFGASTGAAAALWAAGAPDAEIAAVVSRGGRPDLAADRLAFVAAPTLLIVGGHDDVVLDLNRRAAAQLRCEHRLEVVPGATHLFEEPGTLETAAALASGWFVGHMATSRT
ncbi:MAG TPA: phosphoribosyltransferase [Acidimicrobiales bacterium]|nr:phosphoribosyltransferase [Acidimicrobiales bacterium]